MDYPWRSVLPVADRPSPTSQEQRCEAMSCSGAAHLVKRYEARGAQGLIATGFS